MRSLATWHRTFDKVRLVQCALDASAVFVVFFIVRSIYPASRWAAAVAAALYAVSCYNIYYTRAILTESLATFIAAGSTLLGVLALRRGHSVWWFTAGAGWGLMTLCRPEYLPFSFVIAALALLVNRRRSVAASARSLAMVLLGVLLVVTPWVVRNYVLFHEPVVTVGGPGLSLFLGTFETNTNWLGWDTFPAEAFRDAREKDAAEALYRTYRELGRSGSVRIKEADDAFLRVALERIRRDPWTVARTWVIRIPCLWYQFYVPMYRDLEPSGLVFIGYFLLAVYALVRAPSDEKLLMAPIVLLFVYLTLLHLPLHVEPRYGVPFMPALISLCGIGAWGAASFGLPTLCHRALGRPAG